MEELTTTQKRALQFIHTSHASTGTVPTLRELCTFMGYKAIGSAQDLIASLRKKGFLQVPDRQAARTLLITEKARMLFESVIAAANPLDDSFMIPCLGAVPAGDPLEAIENAEQTICVAGSLFGSRRPDRTKLFGLKAKGRSMINAGILDGDWLVIASQNSVESGAIVVARMDGDATVKRLMKDSKRGFFLQPENEDFSPIFADETPFEVIGKVVALQRSLNS